MGRWISRLWRALNFIRNLVFNLVFLFLVIVIVSLLPGSTTIEVPEGAALVVTPRGELVDSATAVTLLEGLTGNGSVAETSLPDLLSLIEHARNDDNIQTLVLQLDELRGGGFSKLRELARALERFRDSGKRIIAHADLYDQPRYYLASTADEILLDPMGAVELQGFASYQPYFREALDNLDINVHIFRVGEFKSAVEPFRDTGMSDAAREDTGRWLDSLWGLYLSEIQERRDLDGEFLQSYTDDPATHLSRFDGDSARLALESGLVDRLTDHVETRAYLSETLGPGEGADYPRISASDYSRLIRQQERLLPDDGPGVAVITARGNIFDGPQRPGIIGSDTLAAQIRHARDNEDVHALVLRIDTGGGSATASEVIRSELLHFRESGKPLVISMSSVAASGGYWLASAGDHIMANAATLTGSIGIYTLYPTFEEVLDRIGVQVDGVGTTRMSGALVPGRPLPEAAAEAIQLTLENGYQRFLDIVAEGRDMSLDQVASLAEGQVWTGEEALESGLVDSLGSLQNAVDQAAEMAGLEDYRVLQIREGLSPFQRLLRDMTIQTLAPLGHHLGLTSLTPLRASLQGLGSELRLFLELRDQRGLYLHCLECRIY